MERSLSERMGGLPLEADEAGEASTAKKRPRTQGPSKSKSQKPQEALKELKGLSERMGMSLDQPPAQPPVQPVEDPSSLSRLSIQGTQNQQPQGLISRSPVASTLTGFDDSSQFWRDLGIGGGTGPPVDMAEFPKSAYKALHGTAEVFNTIMGMEVLNHPEKIHEAIASGSPKRVADMLATLTKDVATLVSEAALPLVGGKISRFSKQAMDQLSSTYGQAALEQAGPALQAIHAGIDTMASPRQTLSRIAQAVGPLVPLTAGRDKFWEVLSYPFKARVLPSFEGRKSVADIFQPAVERLESKGLDRPFRKAAAQKAITTQAGKDLAAQLGKGSVLDRYEAYKALRGLTSSKTQVIRDWKREVSQSGIEAEYMSSFRKSMKKQLKGEWALSEEAFFHLPAAEGFIKALDASVHGSTDMKVVQNAFKSVLFDPNTPQELKLLARDNYNLLYTTPAAVGEAAKTASVSFLTNNLKRLGVVRDTMPEGAKEADWWISKFPGLKGSFVPRDVEMELRAIQDIPKLLSGNGVLAKFNRMFISPWKVSKLILSPPAHFRNMMSNLILNDVGGLPWYRGDMYYKAMKDMRSNGKYWRELRKETGLGGTFSLADVEHLSGGLKLGANMWDHMMSKFEQATAKPASLYNAEEQWFKLAKYMHNREAGMQTYEAALDAMKWTFNYGEITRATGAIRGTISPFFTWTSKVIPLMAESAVKHPIRFAKWPLMFMGMQQAAFMNQDLSEEEWQWIHGILPDYVREGAFFLLPWRDSKDRLQMLNMTYILPGLGDLSDISRDPAAAFLGSPMLTLGADILRNKTYSGAPLYHDWEPAHMKVTKSLAHVWQALVPNFGIVPGTVDWGRMYDTITDDPEALTWGQMAASSVGLRTAPINQEAMTLRRLALDDIHRAEIGSQMRTELRKARSPEQTSQVVEKYSRLRERMEGDIQKRMFGK